MAVSNIQSVARLGAAQSKDNMIQVKERTLAKALGAETAVVIVKAAGALDTASITFGSGSKCNGVMAVLGGIAMAVRDSAGSDTAKTKLQIANDSLGVLTGLSMMIAGISGHPAAGAVALTLLTGKLIVSALEANQ